jgi:hypothetical protein
MMSMPAAGSSLVTRKFPRSAAMFNPGGDVYSETDR